MMTFFPSIETLLAPIASEFMSHCRVHSRRISQSLPLCFHHCTVPLAPILLPTPYLYVPLPLHTPQLSISVVYWLYLISHNIAYSPCTPAVRSQHLAWLTVPSTHPALMLWMPVCLPPPMSDCCSVLCHSCNAQPLICYRS